MYRLGKFTGKIYPEDYKNCLECCICLTKKDIDDESYMIDLRAKNKLDCIRCRGCPAALVSSCNP